MAEFFGFVGLFSLIIGLKLQVNRLEKRIDRLTAQS